MKKVDNSYMYLIVYVHFVGVLMTLIVHSGTACLSFFNGDREIKIQRDTCFKHS